MMRVLSLSRGLAVSGVIILLTLIILYALRDNQIAWLAFLGFSFLILLGFQVLLFKWMFGGLPFLGGLHPYTQLGLVVVGLPLYLYLSPILWILGNMFSWIKPSNLLPINFWGALLSYVVGIVLGRIITSKVLKYDRAESAREAFGLSEESEERENKHEDKDSDKGAEELIGISHFLAEELSVEHFTDRIVGQDIALREVVKGLKTSVKLLGLREEDGKLYARDMKRFHVLNSMIFVGATGVGKTETAKAIADILKPYGYQFIRIDLNMYSTPESVWTLLGSPRGYVGSDRGGELTRRLMKNPRAVILFDEMEKAHPDLHTAFMTLLDEGYIEEQSTGKRVYLEMGIVIFTSNLYAREISELAQREQDELALEMKLRDFIEHYFRRPELVGRIDKIVPFRNLRTEDLEEICRRILARYNPALNHLARGLTEALKPIEEKYGVRAFVRKVEELAVEGPDAIERFIQTRRGKSKGIDILKLIEEARRKEK